jgi:hypothetical protein
MQAQLFTVPPYAVAVVTTMLICAISDRLRSRGFVFECQAGRWTWLIVVQITDQFRIPDRRHRVAYPSLDRCLYSVKVGPVPTIFWNFLRRLSSIRDHPHSDCMGRRQQSVSRSTISGFGHAQFHRSERGNPWVICKSSQLTLR